MLGAVSPPSDARISNSSEFNVQFQSATVRERSTLIAKMPWRLDSSRQQAVASSDATTR
jgi:hypothetical protein